MIADDDDLPWARKALARVQSFALRSGYFVQKMMPKMHSYHLDDDPDLRSCNLMFKAVTDEPSSIRSEPITDENRLVHFYGRDRKPLVKYVREKDRLDYGKANENEYELVYWSEK